MSKTEDREWVLGFVFQGAKGRQRLKTVGKPSPWGWSWQLALSLAARLLAGEAGADEFSTPCSRWRFMGCLFCSVEEKKEKDEGNTQCLRFPFCLATATKARAWRDWDFTGGVQREAADACYRAVLAAGTGAVPIKAALSSTSVAADSGLYWSLLLPEIETTAVDVVFGCGVFSGQTGISNI